MTTLRDVAKLAGVGVGTASRALTGVGAVSEKSRDAVQLAAKKLNFRPSATARALSNRQSGTIGVLTPRFAGRYFSTAVSVAERVIRRAGKHLIVVSSQDRDDESWADAEGLEFLYDCDCDGILALSPDLTEHELLTFYDRKTPLAFVNRQLKTVPDVCFSVDHYGAGRAVAEYLISLGHRNFATITGPLKIEDARLRHEGFMYGLNQAGVSLDPRLTVEGEYGFKSGAIGATALIETKLPFSAIFCGNDEIAVTANGCLRSAGKTPLIFGYDNMDLLDYFEQKISSVAVPIEMIVSNACSSLLNRCYGGDRPIEYAFETKIVFRGE